MSKATKGARKALIWLGAILALIYAGLAVGVATGATSWTPGLALDLAGGRQIILSPVLEDGATQEIEQSDLDQAVEIIRRRVDASGVAEAEITTQGNNIVVSLPGNPDQDTVDLVAQSAQLQFRPVLMTGDPSPTTSTSASPEPSASASADATASTSATPEPEVSASEMANVVGETDDATVTPEVTSAETDATASATPEPSASASPSATADATTDGPVFGTTDPSSFEWLTEDVQADYAALDCTDIENYSGRSMGDPEAGYVACGSADFLKYAMGPVELSGDDLETATSGPEYTSAGNLTGAYEVRLTFNDEGASKFDEVTQRISELESPRNQFAMVLDGTVISAPSVSARISGGEASITGNFTQEQAESLANQLKFGALPMSLEVQSNQQMSATLGAEQLEKGLIAGAIGLLLVVIYSVFQYRALALVTMGSLVLAGVTTYGMITLLSWGLDYRLSLAGVAGLIVSIGITADSFIVYFERIRDELREGRSLPSAVDHAWKRARRTILASDAISLLAAITLYMLAVGGVRGFAFTLGLTTVIDVLIVMLFTHPVMVLIAKTKFWGEGHAWSGLDPRQLGRERMYKGRGRVHSGASAAPKAATKASAESDDDATEGLTLAERKAAQRKAALATPAVEAGEATEPDGGTDADDHDTKKSEG
ncbi:protein translocase subunit SecD [Demequina sp. NBRC 110057]|uniref:protein translocase subunit SecD n=1 Tax=Demequina sp. NBRC 110057 TaxID=1570346 RepID=UPI0013562CE0|nr:protein translocase subunit SecD [Demequina sp. NBRC 110057]